MRRRAAAALAAIGLVAAGLSAETAAQAAEPAFSGRVTAVRAHLIDGKEQVVDTRNVTVTADVTTGLRDQQNVRVSWTGAHPSANTPLDLNGENGYHSEYPMMIFQCRMSGSASQAPKDRVDPTRCWAPFYGFRSQLNGAGNADANHGDPGGFLPWRLDRYADLADREQFAREPAVARPLCPNVAHAAEHRLPLVAADGTEYLGAGVDDTACGDPPPDAPTVAEDTTVLSLPQNTTVATTRSDGSGSELFSVRDGRTLRSLNCSTDVACAVVAVPIMGISCDPATSGVSTAPTAPQSAQNAVAACTAEGHYPVGSQLSSNGSQENYAVSGALWWSASNWRNRVVIPIQFAPYPDSCDESGGKRPVNFYGSELMIQATTQWAGKICQDRAATPFKHIQTPEPQARLALTSGAVEAAIGSRPPTAPYSVPTVHAPVAMTGFAISYLVDDSTGKRYSGLRMTPRLIAKLLTESYPLRPAFRNQYRYSPPGSTSEVDALAHNPYDITADPEFQAINPGVGTNNTTSGGLVSLIVPGGQSDVVYALTAYLNADPEARAWLDGRPDPWGMQINPNYKGIVLPVQAWPLLDRWIYRPAENDPCPVRGSPPVLPALGAPLARLADITVAVQYAVPASSYRCAVTTDATSVTSYYRFAREQKQTPGRRFVLGVTSLGDQQRYELSAAALQSQSTASATAKIGDASGRSFVQPSLDSLRSVVGLLRYDAATKNWSPPPALLRTDPAGKTAYPGTMLVYADVPTVKLPPADAAGFANALRYMVGPGQQPGTALGQLPDGFLPMTAANGLGALTSYTLRAADAVAAQQGQVPSLFPDAPPPPPTSAGTTSSTTSDGGNAPAGLGGGAGGPGGTGPTPGPAAEQPAGSAAPGTAGAAAKSAPAASSPAAPARAVGRTSAVTNDAAKTTLLALVVLFFLGPVGVGAIRLATRWRARG